MWILLRFVDQVHLHQQDGARLAHNHSLNGGQYLIIPEIFFLQHHFPWELFGLRLNGIKL